MVMYDTLCRNFLHRSWGPLETYDDSIAGL
jgi:hypothetical protein